jgi:hypothetical protein
VSVEPEWCGTHLDDMARLLDGSLLVERQRSIDLGGHLARHNLENLVPELDQQSVEGGVDLLVNTAALCP